MGKIHAYVHSFNVGMVSAAALARVDQEKLRLASELQLNILPHVIGKGQMRPGFGYTGASKSNNRPRAIPFIKAVDDFADLELTDSTLRVWVNDALVTRASVTSTVTNGDFSSSTGWTLTTTGDAVANINSTFAGSLWLAVPNRGGTATCTRSVSTSSAGTEHALRIIVTRGVVTFRCGSSSGADDYISEASLGIGTHSLSFTPSGTYHVWFTSRREPGVLVDSIQVESAGVMELPAPWTTNQLREIRWDQSADIIYLTHNSWQQRKIERRSTTSWSIVLYQADDGPFTLDRTAKVRLKPSGTRGNITLTADGSFFRPEHVGALFRLTHPSVNADFGLGGEDQFTDAIRVAGVATDNDWTNVIAGTFTGTLSVQRGYDGRDSGFNYAGASYTTAGSNSVVPGTTFDNVIHYYRIGFATTDYTSGSATVLITYGGDSGSGVCRVTDYSSATLVSAEVLTNFKNTNYTDKWFEGEWSDNRGWPTAVTFFDGRLWFLREDQFWGSESDGFTLFNLDTEGDSGSIQRSIATGGSVNTGVAMLALQRLMFFTTGAESTARASTIDQPLTPTNISVKDASTQGSALVSPVKLDGRAIFVQKSGTKVYQVLYNFEANDYVSRNLNRLNETIGGDGVVELAVQRQPETYIWAVREDGVALILLYDDSEDALGWFTVETDGEFESIFVLPGAVEDRTYAWIKRTINGQTVRYREKLALRSEAVGGSTTKLADAGIFAAGPTTSVAATHLANETGLIAWATDSNSIKRVLTGLSADASGNIALSATYTNVWVGMPYTGQYKSAKLAYGAQLGTAMLQPKEVSQVGLLMTNVHRDAVSVGPDFDSLTPFDIRGTNGQALTDANAIVAAYDDICQPIGGTWSTDSRVCIEIAPGYPATLLGIVMDIKTNDA